MIHILYRPGDTYCLVNHPVLYIMCRKQDLFNFYFIFSSKGFSQVVNISLHFKEDWII